MVVLQILVALVAIGSFLGFFLSMNLAYGAIQLPFLAAFLLALAVRAGIEEPRVAGRNRPGSGLQP